MSDDPTISLSYTAAGCTQREAALLKSLIALYGARGNVNWQYQNSMEASLVIIGTEMAASGAESLLSGIGSGQAMLWISDNPAFPGDGRQVFLCKPPLRAFHFADKLARIELFLRENLRRSQSRTEALKEEFPDDFCLELALWPAPELLSDDKMLWRLSAMLSVRGMTVAELAERSSLSEDRCRQFLKRLNGAGCLKKISPKDRRKPSLPSVLRVNKTTDGGLPGLFKKIRVSLGLSSS